MNDGQHPTPKWNVYRVAPLFMPEWHLRGLGTE